MKKPINAIIFLFALQFVLAPICAPHSCEWGGSVYVIYGTFSALASFVIPYLNKSWPVNKRVGYSFLFFTCSTLLWALGFLIFGFRIMCRLF